MAFTNLYIQSGGNDMNAGSSTANAADATSTNGSWDITAETFIVAAAGVFSTVPIVGDWASIYIDGVTTGAVYVAQVTAVGALGVSVTLSTTAKYGTKPAASATARSCKINGAWASELPLAAGGLATTTIPASTKINIKAATYTITASRIISMGGAATKSLWVSGYSATPGDLDRDTTNALSRPILACNASVTITFSGSQQTVSGLSITGSNAGGLLTLSGTDQFFSRVRTENTSSNASACAWNVTTNTGFIAAYCWCKTPTTGTSNGCIRIASASQYFIGVVAEGGGLAGFNCLSANTAVLVDCIALNNTGAGVISGSAGTTLQITGLTVYNATGDGVKWAAAPGTGNFVVRSLFSNCGGYGINQASGTNSCRIVRASNDFYSCTSGIENGFGDHPALFGQTESGSPVTSSTDMTPVLGSSARANGFPGLFENETFGSFADIGAVRHADPTSGGQSVQIFGG